MRKRFQHVVTRLATAIALGIALTAACQEARAAEPGKGTPKPAEAPWVPANKPVRGVIFNTGKAMFEALPEGSVPEPWRGVCERNGLVWGGYGGNLRSLAKLAEKLGRPELANAPMIFAGLSTGGGNAILCAQEYPDRTLAVLAEQPVAPYAKGNEGFNFNRFNPDSANPGARDVKDVSQTLTVPMFLQTGGNDTLLGVIVSYGFLDFGRRQDAPWTFFCLRGGGHGTRILPEAGTAWLEAVVAQRLPADVDLRKGPPKLKPIRLDAGWLGHPQTLEIAAWSDYPGNKLKACWLPDKATADAWKKHSQGTSYELPEQPLRQPSGVIADLVVHDPRNNKVVPSDAMCGNAWKIVANLKEGDNGWAEGTFQAMALGKVPALVRGCDWIKPDARAADFAGETLLEFTVSEEAGVYVAHDEGIAKKPAWLADWKDTGEFLLAGKTATDQRFRLFEKAFPKGARVKLGPNSETGPKPAAAGWIYITIVKPAGARSAPLR